MSVENVDERSLKVFTVLSKKEEETDHHSAEAFAPSAVAVRGEGRLGHDLNTRQVPDGKVQLVALTHLLSLKSAHSTASLHLTSPCSGAPWVLGSQIPVLWSLIFVL